MTSRKLANLLIEGMQEFTEFLESALPARQPHVFRPRGHLLPQFRICPIHENRARLDLTDCLAQACQQEIRIFEPRPGFAGHDIPLSYC